MEDSIKDLAGMTVRSVKREGVKATAKKVYSYIRYGKRRVEQRGGLKWLYADVLFINGCYLPHPSRYRVSHQREQLLAKNIVTSEIFYTDLTLDLVKRYRLFIFYRCPYTDTVGEFIELAKKYHKHVLFDMDDLLIDESYTRTIDYIKTLPQSEQDIYYDGIRLMQKTLKLCEGAITTTEAMAAELKKFVPEAYINRNLASDRMVQLSEEAYLKRQMEEPHNTIDIGYFSGNITHDQDFELILPAITKLMESYANVRLCLAGEITLPEKLKQYEERVVINKLVNWEKLPELIASVDINIAPLVDTLFNRAKSENKWVEAALVRVPTVASDTGAFARMIQDGKTGILCENTESAWFVGMESLVKDINYRKQIAQNAYQYVIENCTTIVKSAEFAEYIKMWFTPNIFMVLPQTQIAGGVLVALRHCIFLMKNGYDVTVLNEGNADTKELISFEGNSIPMLNKSEVKIFGSIDTAVGTLWTTMDFVTTYGNIKNRIYFVQNYETNFYKAGEYFKVKAEQTYLPVVNNVKFITISKWCENWLRDKYHHESLYAPNGIDVKKFSPRKRMFDSKIRILIEGNSNDDYKNVDESFQIVDRLDKDKFEIWYMSYQGKPKSKYYVDKFLHQVPYEKVPDVYRQCDILIKTSILESFSYPPLEMMATGGYVVVVPNGGNIEYLVDGENCMMYPQGDIEKALQCIERLVNDSALRDNLYQRGLETAKARDWSTIEEEIVRLYQ
jgi:glycosyltransferase involved in cell wall biosynthesis